MNNLKLVVGEKFKGNRSGNVFEIVSIAGDTAIIRVPVLDRVVPYSLIALKRLAVTPVEEVQDGDR